MTGSNILQMFENTCVLFTESLVYVWLVMENLPVSQDRGNWEWKKSKPMEQLLPPTFRLAKWASFLLYNLVCGPFLTAKNSFELLSFNEISASMSD